ncbi:GNAT family N-acetyltransferase [Amnimonas aquatica]|uniref:N-acetyltransferase n=1 Tax=Amnimonas aquatica TaxID=2094561 RepID=A0A2P6ARU8_9GAMM|nr:GNAT family N-acetyltransferase [Amnimonas aquatica]PQA38503.1 N-acetyltransferase [Amnimonas aquatica]
MPVRVEIAETPAQYADGGKLFREYADFLGVDLGFQDFAGEMATLPVMYGPPDGSLLLAWLDGHCIGAVGLRRLAPGVAEMKRLFVQPGHQGSGAGRALVEAFIARAGVLGYRRIRLDTLRSLTAALALYRHHGFVEIAPYYHNPLPDVVFMERVLP